MKRILKKLFSSELFTTQGTLPNTLMRRIYYAALSIIPTRTGIDDALIAQVLHFDKSCLYQERFTLGAIKASLKTIEARFSAIDAYYLLSDKQWRCEHPKLIQIKIGDIEKLGGGQN